MFDADPLALRVARQFLGRGVLAGVDPDVRLRHVERLTRGLIERIGRDPKSLSVGDLCAALAEIANEAKVRR